MKSLKVKKIAMTQIFDEEGKVYPVTIVQPFTEESPESGSSDEQITLKDGDKVIVSGQSKGKGFQGVVKRHGFAGGRRSHGQKHSEREPGSIGGGGRAGGRVVKGMRMAGRMGNDKVTIKNLKVHKVLLETKEIFIQGAIPGRRGSVLNVRRATAE